MECNYGERLKQLRQNKGVSLATAAEHIGITAMTLSRYETGTREPGVNVLLQLLEYYGMSAAEFFTGYPQNIRRNGLPQCPDAEASVELFCAAFAETIAPYVYQYTIKEQENKRIMQDASLSQEERFSAMQELFKGPIIGSVIQEDIFKLRKALKETYGAPEFEPGENGTAQD